MILRAFEEACCCLNRIHEAGVCHFDIKSDNILVRSSARELSRRLLQNDEIDKPSKGWLCFADFGEAKVVDTDRIPVRTATFSSFSSSAASPGAPKRTEKCMSLTRTRGTEAIKSPEVLKIKGSEVAVKVTLASDIWSIGCLLFELVTQELLFQNDDWAAGNDILAIEAFESQHVDHFVHFVYLSWHESGDANVHKASHFIEEIHEEKHRTSFLLNARVTLDLHVLQQHAALYFSVIQRRLRDEAGCVVFVALGKDAEDTKTLQEILTNILFFFFRSVLNMSIFDILNCFARDCAQFFEYPSPEYLKQLESYSNTHMENTDTSTMPFDEEEDMDPLDSLFVHDKAEEKIMFPLEVRGPWVVLDVVSVTRGTTPPIITSDRRMSRFNILKRQASKAAEDTRANTETQELVRGLQRGKISSSSDTWEMNECGSVACPSVR
ncbi:hypothetical protein PInf_014739 [Phytophthora infestans]|nr:hypothetical protein PInf_014739 [Phytophthora infestans]